MALPKTICIKNVENMLRTHQTSPIHLLSIIPMQQEKSFLAQWVVHYLFMEVDEI